MRREFSLLLLSGAGAALLGGCQAQPNGPTTRPLALMAQGSMSTIDAPPPPAAERPAQPVEAPRQPPVGRACSVHFRRDALGLSSPAPLSVSSETIAGRAVVLKGTLRELTPDWLVVETEGRSYWVPRAAVLLLEFADK